MCIFACTTNHQGMNPCIHVLIYCFVYKCMCFESQICKILSCHLQIHVNFCYYGIYRNQTEIIWYIPKLIHILNSYRITEVSIQYKPNNLNRESDRCRWAQGPWCLQTIILGCQLKEIRVQIYFNFDIVLVMSLTDGERPTIYFSNQP